jgi:hypothetical protein
MTPASSDEDEGESVNGRALPENEPPAIDRSIRGENREATGSQVARACDFGRWADVRGRHVEFDTIS